MKKLLLLLILCASAAFAQTTTSVTGTVKDLTGANVTSGQVAFTLQPGIDATMSGTARFSPSEVDCSITGTGAVKALDGVSTCTVQNNTALQPSGTSYKVCVQPQFAAPGSCFVWYAIGGSVDLTQQVPTPPLVPAYALVDTFSNQTIAGNKTFTGIISGTFADSIINQKSNGDDAISSTRATDTSPAGNFINFKTLSGGSLFKIDINGNIISKTAVFAAGPWFDVTSPAYGALCDGSTDDTAAFMSAITAASANGGGMVYIPPGKVCVLASSATTALDLTNTRNVGIGSILWSVPFGGTTEPRLRFTGTPTNLIAFDGSAGFFLWNVYIQYSNPSFTGTILNGHGTTGNASLANFVNIGIGSTSAGPNTAAVCLSFDQTISSGLYNSRIDNCAVGVQGLATGGSFSSAITLQGNHFSNSTGDITTALIRNPGQAWAIVGNTLEMGAAVGSPHAMDCTVSGAGAGVGFGPGNWVGDDSSSIANTFFVGCAQVSYTGNLIGAASHATIFDLSTVANQTSIVGNALSSLSGSTIFSFGSSTANVRVEENTYPVVGTFSSGTPNRGCVTDNASTQNCYSNWTFGSNFTLKNLADAPQRLSIVPGLTADQESSIDFFDKTTTLKWRIRKDSANSFAITDGGQLQRLVLSPAETGIEAPANSSNGILINDGANAGTGGIVFCSGGASPTCHIADITSAGLIKGTTYGTETNCASSGGTCASAPAGRVSIAAAATTVTVATTAVTANSEIFIQEDATLGAALSVTCNTTAGRTYAVTTRTAGTSFVITTNSAPTTNPACLSYHIVN